MHRIGLPPRERDAPRRNSSCTAQAAVELAGSNWSRQACPVRSMAKAWPMDTILCCAAIVAGWHTHVDRLEHEQRVAVDQVVQRARAQRHAGDDLERLAGLARAGQAAVLQQRQDRVGDDVGMDAQNPCGR
jgi:hypothetical protein